MVGASLALASAPAASAAAPCTDSWVGGDGNWFVASNWSSGAVPGPNDAVCITAPASYTITIQGSQAQADTLQLGATSGTQKLVIQADNSCGENTGSGGLEVFDHGGAATAATIGSNGQVELTQNGNTCSGVANGASLRVDAGTLSNAGLMTTDSGPVAASAVTGRVLQGSISNAGGTIMIAANTTWSGSTFDNAGTITFPVVAVLTVPAGSGARFINDTGGLIGGYVQYQAYSYVFVDRGNTFQQGDGQANPQWSRPGVAAVVVLHDATLEYTGNGRSNIEAEGQTTLVGDVPSQALLAVDCSGDQPAVLHTGSFTNAGFIGLYGRVPDNCTSGRSLSVDSSAGPGTGTLTNTGQIEGFGTIAANVSNTTGTIAPGDTFPTCSPCTFGYAPGQITVTGSYAQGPDGTLGIITYGALFADGSLAYSQLSVAGTASVAGTLKMWNGGVGHVAAGDVYQVLTAARVTGAFAKLTGQPDPSTAVQYVPTYNPANVTIDVVKIPTLTVKFTGNGSGSVYSWQALLNCTSGSCTMGLSPGQTVTLNATPSAHTTFNTWRSTFAGWSGACHGTGPCILTMDGDKSVTATFARIVPPRCTLALKSPTAEANPDRDRRLRQRVAPEADRNGHRVARLAPEAPHQALPAAAGGGFDDGRPADADLDQVADQGAQCTAAGTPRNDRARAERDRPRRYAASDYAPAAATRLGNRPRHPAANRRDDQRLANQARGRERE